MEFEWVWLFISIKKGKGFLFNVGNRQNPESLFPAEPPGVFYLPSTQSRLVLLETVLN